MKPKFIAGVALLVLAHQSVFSKELVMHATPAECPPSTLIAKIFETPFAEQSCIVIYAEVDDVEAYAIGINEDGGVVGLRRKMAVETDRRIESYPVELLKMYNIPTARLAQIKCVFLRSLKQVKFAEEVDISTGASCKYIIGVDRFFGEIRDSYGGSALASLATCRLLVKCMKDEQQRDTNLKELYKLLDEQTKQK